MLIVVEAESPLALDHRRFDKHASERPHVLEGSLVAGRNVGLFYLIAKALSLGSDPRFLIAYWTSDFWLGLLALSASLLASDRVRVAQ